MDTEIMVRATHRTKSFNKNAIYIQSILTRVPDIKSVIENGLNTNSIQIPQSMKR